MSKQSQAVKRGWAHFTPAQRKKRMLKVARVRSKNLIWIRNHLAACRTSKERVRRAKAMSATWKNPTLRSKIIKAIHAAWSNPKTRARLCRMWYRYEKEVRVKLQKQGWAILARGWPDFICVRGRKVRFIEAKGPRGKLTSAQQKVHKILKRFGIQVEVIRP